MVRSPSLSMRFSVLAGRASRWGVATDRLPARVLARNMTASRMVLPESSCSGGGGEGGGGARERRQNQARTLLYNTRKRGGHTLHQPAPQQRTRLKPLVTITKSCTRRICLGLPSASTNAAPGLPPGPGDDSAARSRASSCRVNSLCVRDSVVPGCTGGSSPTLRLRRSVALADAGLPVGRVLVLGAERPGDGESDVAGYDGDPDRVLVRLAALPLAPRPRLLCMLDVLLDDRSRRPLSEPLLLVLEVSAGSEACGKSSERAV